MSGARAAPLALGLVLGATEARGAEELSEEDEAVVQKLSEPRGFYGRLLVSNAFGVGFRFNNPYRLRRQLGDTAESVSLTSPYYDAGLAMTFGEPNHLQHGMALRLSVGVEGVPQQALGGSYLVLHRGSSPFMVYGRLGGSVLLQPDANFGLEAAAGAAWFFTGAIGLGLELVGDLFYGAATYESEITTYPIVSAQGGLHVDWEILP